MKKIVVFIFVAMFAFHVGANSELSKIQSEIKQAKIAERQLQEKYESSNRDIQRTKKDLVYTATKFSELEHERAKIKENIKKLTDNQKDLTEKLEENRSNIADSAAAILFVANNPNFDSDNMKDYVLTSAVLSGAATNFQDEIDLMEDQIEELEDIKDELESEIEKLDETAERFASQKKELDDLLRDRSAQNKNLKTQQTNVQKKLKTLSAKAKNISDLASGVGSSEMSGSSRFSFRKLNPPVKGDLIQKFGDKLTAGRTADGWKIAASGGALVVAPADGVVKFADDFKGFGQIIIISHKNGYNTVMTNLGQIDVLINQEVLGGEPVGRMSESKPEMYLEVRRGKSVVDPEKLFKTP